MSLRNSMERSRTPPITTKRGGKMMAVRIQLLDDSINLFQVQQKANGQVLFEQVCRQLSLLESDYFGLEYEDGSGTKYWLDLDKPMNCQLGLSMMDPLLKFCVKFYTPDPAQLEEEYTRYLFSLQIKHDLAVGLLQCNDNTAALMASYIVQGDCGDYVEEDYPTHAYLSSYKFFPHQNSELERKIMENHKKHVGQSPAEADLNLLETARRCDLYGIKMHPAKDHELVPLNLAVAHMGILVFQNYTKINTFSWAKIRKLSFKRKRFLIKLHPEGFGYYKDTVEFFFDGRNECKNFWKKCVEHHGFFRCSTVKRSPRQKTKILSRGSSFRYSGRTQKQMIEFVRENFVRRQSFQRSHSFRHSNSIHSSVANVGTSVSAQPLLPLSDNMLSTSISRSCGSMTLSSKADPQSPCHTVDFPDFDHKDIDISYGISRQGTLSQETSTASSPQRYLDRYQDDDLSSPVKANYSSSDNTELAVPPPVEISSYLKPIDVSLSQRGEKHNFSDPSEDKENQESNIILHDLAKDKGDDNFSGKIEVGQMSIKDATKDRMVYHVFKDLLNNERTYKKDLEVINLWLRDEVNKEEAMPEDILTELFNLIDPLHELHSDLLKELELRYRAWEKKSSFLTCSFGDLLLNKLPVLKVYEPYLLTYFGVLEKLSHAYKQNKKFEQVYRDFELQKICYQPLNIFILRPLYRLFHYQAFFEKLVCIYSSDHCDYSDSNSFLKNIQEFTAVADESLKKSENFVKLFELQRDIIGIDNLIQSDRKFIREGSVYKSSPKGSQQRMLFLFSDILLYGSRAFFPQFKLHNQISLRGLMLESGAENSRIPNSFTIYGGQRVLVLVANSYDEKELWVRDIKEAIKFNKDKIYNRPIDLDFLTMKSSSSMDEVSEQINEETSPMLRSLKMSVKSAPELNCTTTHVCWHRRTMLGYEDIRLPLLNLMSGFLLRKFKNNKGWQRLWVVYSHFSLFFYKSYHDDLPLACLPLLGYKLSVPQPNDKIEKNHVFKLEFRGHMYFFCAESDHPFRRWMDVIQSVTSINSSPKIPNGNSTAVISNDVSI